MEQDKHLFQLTLLFTLNMSLFLETEWILQRFYYILSGASCRVIQSFFGTLPVFQPAICSKLTMKELEEICWKLTIYQWRRSGVFTVNFEHITHLVLMFLLLTLSRQMPAGVASSFFQMPIISIFTLYIIHVLQIEWLVSVWIATLGWNGLTKT